MSGRWITAVSAGIALVLRAHGAQAMMVTFEFGGVVTSVKDPAGALSGGVQVNDGFSGAFTFDSATPDSMPGDPTSGYYPFANAWMTVLVGAVAVSADPGAGHDIAVTNGPFGDGFTMGSSTFQSGSLWVSELYVYLNDPTKTAFDSDALPLVPPNLAKFARREFSFQGQGGFDVRGDVTVLTPEPGALALLVLAALSILPRR